MDEACFFYDSNKAPTGLKQKIKEPSQYFSNFFNAYSRSLNIATQSTGVLFTRPFKRIPRDSETYPMRLLDYIHQNPQKHGFAPDLNDWDLSSYHSIIENSPTCLAKNKVPQLFESREDFTRIHQEIQPFTEFEDDE